MVEPMMYFGIGFLVAALLMIGVIPLVHGRAVRLTRKRIEAMTPVSMAEIQADKDQLRAEFAMTTRRLEMSVEQMKAKTTGQLAEISKKSEAISKLKVELAEKTAALLAIEAREKAFKDQIHHTEEEFAVKAASLRQAERSLAEKRAELERLSAQLNERAIVADSQKVEAVALRAQIEALKGQVEHFDREAREVQERLIAERRNAKAMNLQLEDERGRVEFLGRRVSELEEQAAAQSADTELLGQRARDLEARLAEQGRLLAERDYQCDQLRQEIAAAQRAQSELRETLDTSDRQYRGSTDRLRKEKAALEQQLRQALDDNAALQGELGAVKRETEHSWASERVENALLRERINDVAAEVARLTATLEGPGSPIETILAESPPTADETGPMTNGHGARAENGGAGKGSLADRIRLLQSRASRVPQTN